MSAYAIGHLRNVTMGPEIVEYLRRIDDDARAVRQTIHQPRRQCRGDGRIVVGPPDRDRVSGHRPGACLIGLRPIQKWLRRSMKFGRRNHEARTACRKHRATDILAA